jgi:tetratricopeptide (TPR) repeat protein
MSFQVTDSISGRVVDIEGQEIENISIIFGLLANQTESWLTAISVADYDEADINVGVLDYVVIDFTFLDTILNAGDEASMDLVLAQTLPSKDGEDESGLSPEELFARRWNSGSIYLPSLEFGGELQAYGIKDHTVDLVEGSIYAQFVGKCALHACAPLAIEIGGQGFPMLNDWIQSGVQIISSRQMLNQNFPNPTISGWVWADLDRDGRYSGEFWVPGVRVSLYDGLNGKLLATTTTDRLGRYSFSGSRFEGNYIIHFQPDETYRFGPRHAGGGAISDSDAYQDPVELRGWSHEFRLDPGESEVGINAALIPEFIGDLVWHDIDRDGRQDSNEPGIQGAHVFLMRVDEDGAQVVADEFTRENGEYDFFNVEPGNYYLEFFPPPNEDGWLITEKDAAPDNLDSDVFKDDENNLITDTFTYEAGFADFWDAGLFLVPEEEYDSVEPPDDAESALEMGIRLYEVGELEDALAAFVLAIQLDEEFKEAYYNAGIILYELGNYSEALEYFRAAIALDPTYDMAYYGRALVAMQFGEAETELSAWLSFLENHPESDEFRDYANQRVIALQSIESDSEENESQSGEPSEVSVSGSFAHTNPGVSSEVYLHVSGSPGTTVEAAISGPGVQGTAERSGTIGEDGQASFTWTIDSYGTYTINGTVGGQSFSVDVNVE